jgi:alpha-L-rhamnosidase
MNSQNHVMLLGDLLIWLYEDLAGIKSDNWHGGFKEIVMRPSFPKGLNEVNASYRSLYGTISSHWKKEGNNTVWNISIPANTKAIIYIPATNADEVKDRNRIVAETTGAKLLKVEEGSAVFEVGSGNYSFTITSSPNK